MQKQQSKTLDGLLFNQNEFLVLMNAAGANNLIGINMDMLIPTNRELHGQMVVQGIEELKDRGLVEEIDGVMVLPSELLAMATAVAHPQWVTQLVRAEQDGTQRIGLIYQSYDVIVEFSMPTNSQFRLATLPSTPATLQRIQFLTGLQNVDTDEMQFKYPQEQFFQIKQLVERSEADLAIDKLIDDGVSQNMATQLTTAIASPQNSGTITLLRVDNDQIRDGRDMAFLQSADSAWMIYQSESNVSEFIVSTITTENILVQLLESQSSLAKTS